MNVIESIKQEIQTIFKNDASGHDYWHSIRVYDIAMQLADTEVCHKKMVAVAALLHDVDDSKLFSTTDYETARTIMRRYAIDDDTAERIVDIIKAVPFSSGNTTPPDSIEGKIVQDADRLDAMGAIGIARTFAFGGSRGIPIFQPPDAPSDCMTSENQRSSIDHFYHKLFLLKSRMNTKAAREIAEQRDAFMHTYMDAFFNEWKGVSPL